LGFEVDTEEAAGPASSYNADQFAESLGFGSAEELADYLSLEGGEDELAQILRDSANPRELAEALDFSSAQELADDLGVDRRAIADGLRDQSGLNELAELEELAEAQGLDEDEFAQLLANYSEDPDALAEALRR
jgi:uncharacterized protein YidB (DUF937 family)